MKKTKTNNGIVNTYVSQADIDYDDKPDSQATVEQIKNAGKWLGLEEPTPNYWKYACISILLGLVAGMILATSPIINALDVCLK